MTNPARWPSWILTATVVVVGFTATASATVAAEHSLVRDRNNRFDAAAERARAAVSGRLDLYRSNLTHVRGWMMVNQDVSREQFTDLVALGFRAGLYPGVHGVSYSPRVRREDLPAFEASVRTDTATLESFPPFVVHPTSGEADSYVVTYIVPAAGNEVAFGFDLGSDPARRAAVEAARDRGDAVGTGPLRLVQEIGSQSGFLLLSPVYDTATVPLTEPARRRHFVGIISMVFRFGDVFAGVFGLQPETNAEMYDLGPTVDPPTLRFDSSTRLLDTAPGSTVSLSGETSALHRDLDLNIGDRRWRMVLTTGPGFEERGRTLPWVVSILGSLISLLVAAILSATLRARARAERRAMEMTADVRAAEARSASILFGAPDAMLVVDGSGRILNVNLAAEALFGYPAKDLEGQLIEILLPEDAAVSHRAHRARYVEAPRRREMGADLDLFGRRRDGTSFPVEVSLSPLIGPAGSLEVIAAVRDASDRRVVQASLQAAYDYERETAEQLREANELKTRFLNTMSHELRTPLTAITGFTDLLLSSSLQGEQKDDYLRRIRRNALSLSTLIGDVLAFAHLDQQDVPLKPVPLDLAAEVRLVVEQLLPILQGHEVIVDAPGPVPTLVDREALTRITTNLLTNVARYTPDGTSVTVSVEQRGDRAVLAVSDEGPGIPPEEQDRVFERFFRGATALVTRMPGTGIGLAVVNDLAMRSGGSARVVPGNGVGARFEIELPTAAVTPANDPGGLGR